MRVRRSKYSLLLLSMESREGFCQEEGEGHSLQSGRRLKGAGTSSVKSGTGNQEAGTIRSTAS